MYPYTVPDKALLRLTAHPAKRRAPPQPDVRPPLRSIGHRTRIQQARHKRGRSAPACGLGHRPGLAGTRKGYPFLLCTPLHRHADVRLCCAGKRPKGARSPIFGHTRVSIALFRQICDSIPAQNLLTHSIKYGQKHRQKMSLPLPKTPPVWVVFLAVLLPIMQASRLSSHGRSVPPARCSPSQGPDGPVRRAFVSRLSAPARNKKHHPSGWCFWQGQKGSNSRHAVLETAALPTELYPYVVGLRGLEPGTGRL